MALCGMLDKHFNVILTLRLSPTAMVHQTISPQWVCLLMWVYYDALYIAWQAI